MARIAFEKGQRVYVRPLHCFARIEKINPQWVKGVEVPMRVHYDVGLGRDFTPAELADAERREPAEEGEDRRWRVRRVAAEGLVCDGAQLPTLPAVMTSPADAGGWRVSAAEYDRRPSQIEREARLIAAAPDLFEAVKLLSDFADAHPQAVPAALAPALARAGRALRTVYDVPEPESMLTD